MIWTFQGVLTIPRPVAGFVLASADKAILQGWLRKGTTPNRLARRARIVLLLGERVAPGRSVNSTARPWQASFASARATRRKV